jgi:diguanylate cyclase (GGDEF)-like protein
MTKLRTLRLLTAVLTLWLSIIAFAGYLLMSMEIRQIKVTFDENVGDFVSAVRHKLDTNEAVIAGFASFLQAVERNGTDATTRYASSIVSAYPHIYMLEVARKLDMEDQSGFVNTLRRRWRADFSVKEFQALQGTDTRHGQPQKFVWPIVFMYPSLPEAQAIYGVRLETVDYVSNVLPLANGNTRPIATPVFNMYEGGSAYILFQEIIRPQSSANSGLDFFGNTMFGLLLIKTGALWPKTTTFNDKKTSIEGFLESHDNARHLLFKQEAVATNWADQFFLPTFSRQIKIESASQPTVISFHHQLQWSELLHWEVTSLLLLLIALMFLVSWLMLRHYKQICRNAIEHERSIYLATHDLLTNLPNRFLFKDRFEQVLQLSRRNGNPFALVLLDLDNFKNINDQHGHQAGDEVLRTCAERMALELRASDTVARHGGDEFIILLGNVLNAEDACVVVEKIRASITKPIETSVGPANVSCSIGVALYPVHGEELDSLSALADQAMYLSKKRGKNMVTVCA